MKGQSKIYGYMFKVISQKAENSWVAFCPGVGGIYEEGETKDDAISNAYSAACAILDARASKRDCLVEESEYLRVFRQPISQAAIASLEPAEQEYVATIHC